MKIIIEKSGLCSNKIKEEVIHLQYEVMYIEQNNSWPYELFSQDMLPLLNNSIYIF